MTELNQNPIENTPRPSGFSSFPPKLQDIMIVNGESVFPSGLFFHQRAVLNRQNRALVNFDEGVACITPNSAQYYEPRGLPFMMTSLLDHSKGALFDNILSQDGISEIRSNLVAAQSKIWKTMDWVNYLGYGPELIAGQLMGSYAIDNEDDMAHNVATVTNSINECIIEKSDVLEEHISNIIMWAVFVRKISKSTQKYGWIDREVGLEAEELSIFQNIDVSVKLLHEFKDNQVVSGIITNMIRDIVYKDSSYIANYAIKSLAEYSLKIEEALLTQNSEEAQYIANDLLSEVDILTSLNVRSSEEDYNAKDDLAIPSFDAVLSTMKDLAYKTLYPKIYSVFEKAEEIRDGCATKNHIYNMILKMANTSSILDLLDGKSESLRRNEIGSLDLAGRASFYRIPTVLDEDLQRYEISAHKHISRLMDLFAGVYDKQSIKGELSRLENTPDILVENGVLENVLNRYDTNKARLYTEDSAHIIDQINLWILNTGLHTNVRLQSLYIREQEFTMVKAGDINRIHFDFKNGDINDFIRQGFSEVEDGPAYISKAAHLHFEIDVEDQKYPLKFEVQISTKDLRRNNLLFGAIYPAHTRYDDDLDSEQNGL